MKRLMIAAVVAVAGLNMAACATFDPEKWAAAVNEHDKDCYAVKKLDITPMMLGAWVVPVISAHYEAVCNADRAPGAAPALKVGALVSPSVSP